MTDPIRATKARVCRADDLPPGARRIVNIDHREIAVMNVGGHHYAVRNRCPHQGGPVGRGEVGGTLLPSSPGELAYGLEDRVLTCPWHHWEFDLSNGCAIFDQSVRVKIYEVLVEDGVVWIAMEQRSATAKE